MTTTALRDELARHLKVALQLSADEAQALLWEEPRSLLLSVVPTAVRRLKNNWQTLQEKDFGAEPGAMLPEFVTRTLFDPLNVPEVGLILPFASRTTGRSGDSDSTDELLPIARALRKPYPAGSAAAMATSATTTAPGCPYLQPARTPWNWTTALYRARRSKAAGSPGAGPGRSGRTAPASSATQRASQGGRRPVTGISSVGLTDRGRCWRSTPAR